MIKQFKGEILDFYCAGETGEGIETTEFPSGTSMVFVGKELWKVDKSPIQTAFFNTEKDTNGIQKIIKENFPENPDEVLKEVFPERKYKSDLLYLLECNWADFPIPTDKFRQVMKYFRDVYAKHKCESAVLLMVNIETKDWEVLYPLQTDTSGAAVTYIHPVITNNNPRISALLKNDDARALQSKVVERYNELFERGYKIWGTIHSHCNFSAFHSGVDDADEMDFNGLHITIGNVDGNFSYCGRYILEKRVYTAEMTEVLDIEDISNLHDNIDEVEVPQEYMDLIYKEPVRTYNYVVSSGNNVRSWKNDNNPRTWDPDTYSGGYSGQSSFNYTESKIRIIKEKRGFRLYNLKDKEYYWVEIQDYYANKEYFKNYIRLADPPEDPEVVKYESEEENTPEKKEIVSIEKDTNVIVLNTPETNPNCPEGPASAYGLK